MVKNSIKVYARIRRVRNHSKIGIYEIKSTKSDHQEIEFRCGSHKEYRFYKNSKLKYQFNSIFDQDCSQTDVFDIIAVPVINTVLEGYNGTIFAYGQTGSGKTYSITGSTECESRGIIPRTIEYIFEHVEQNTDILYNMYISYLEIYNEVGYDLLTTKHGAANLEELPRVTILEDSKGEIHLRNLNVLSVCSEREALCLLFLGDTNRTIAETPMNAYSSRSHCIFTLHIAATLANAGIVRRSKLHLVDLAGSERIHKSDMSGSLLFDARHINLSLHYLEQVITALSDPNRVHVPYRNSVMTTVLRDSLGGNCLTVMLATLSVEVKNFEETLSTCKFSKRVALITSDAFIINEEDPKLEIIRLRAEIENLRNELALYKKSRNLFGNTKGEISPRKFIGYEKAVHNYLQNTTDVLQIPVDQDISNVQNYFKIFKKLYHSQQEIINGKLASQSAKEPEIKILEEVIQEKNCEIIKLITLLDQEKSKSIPAGLTDCMSDEPQQYKLPNSLNEQIDSGQTDSQAFECFMKSDDNKNQLTPIVDAIQQKYKIAENILKEITMCKQNIVNIKKRIRANINNTPENSNVYIGHLKSQQTIYREKLTDLTRIKKEVDHLNHSLEQEKVKSLHKFNEWRAKQQKTVVPLSEIFLDNLYNWHNNSDLLRNVSVEPTKNQVQSNDDYFHQSDAIIPQTLNKIRKIYPDQSSGYNSPNDCNLFDNNDAIGYYTDYNITPKDINFEEELGDLKQSSNTFANHVQNRSRFTLLNRPETVPFDENQRLASLEQLQLGPNHGRQSKSIPNQIWNETISEENYKQPFTRQSVSQQYRIRSADTLPEKLDISVKINKTFSNQNEEYQNKLPNRSECSVHQDENGFYLNMLKLNSARYSDENQKSSIRKERQTEANVNFDEIPLTGDSEVDEEIIAFYKAQQNLVNTNK